jgi:hypothetical protein
MILFVWGLLLVSILLGGLWSLTPLSTNRSTQRKPLTCRNSLTKLYHIMLDRVHVARAGFEFTTLGMIGTNCIGSCKSNYHTIGITTVPILLGA